MGLFRRKDPLESRARALKARLAGLESQIQQLNQAGAEPPETPPSVHELKPGDEPLPPRPSHPLSEQHGEGEETVARHAPLVTQRP